jgi:maltose O-acetyltransferase
MYRYFFIKTNQLVCKLRDVHCKKSFSTFGDRSRILGRIKVYSPENIYLGHDTSINEGVILNARTKLTIGSHVHISPGVIINTGSLDYEKKGAERKHVAHAVTISDGVWLGSGCIINPGVTIGENTVIGAGAVVTKDIPPNCVAVGIPARVMKEI